MTPPPTPEKKKKKYPQIFILKKLLLFWNFEPKIMLRTIIYMKISEYLPPPGYSLSKDPHDWKSVTLYY